MEATALATCVILSFVPAVPVGQWDIPAHYSELWITITTERQNARHEVWGGAELSEQKRQNQSAGEVVRRPNVSSERFPVAARESQIEFHNIY